MILHDSIRVRALTGLVAFASIALSSCADSTSGGTYAYVFDELRVLTRFEMVDGVSHAEGFDLDGFDGPAPTNTCRSSRGDHIARDGRTGIDNVLASDTFAYLANVIAAGQGGGDGTELFATLLQDSITTGELAVLLQFDGVSSFENDDDVTMTLFIGLSSEVSASTDGRLLAGQSFEVNPAVDPVTVRTRIIDGVVLAEGIQIQARGTIVGVEIDLPIRQAQLRLEFNPTGTITGILGGAVPWKALAEIVPELGTVSPEIAAIGPSALRGLADIVNEETGECDALSVSMRAHGVSAFIVDPPPEPAAEPGNP